MQLNNKLGLYTYVFTHACDVTSYVTADKCHQNRWQLWLIENLVKIRLSITTHLQAM